MIISLMPMPSAVAPPKIYSRILSFVSPFPLETFASLLSIDINNRIYLNLFPSSWYETIDRIENLLRRRNHMSSLHCLAMESVSGYCEANAWARDSG